MSMSNKKLSGQLISHQIEVLATKQFVSTIFCALVVGLLSHFATSAQDGSDRLESKFIKLGVDATKVKASTGQKIEIPVTLINNFTNDVYLTVDSVTDRLAGYTVKITDYMGKTIQKSEDPDPYFGGPGSREIAVIPPKKVLSHVLVLSDYYKLKPGKYTIFITALVHNYKRKESVWVAAQPIQLINH